MAIFQPHEQALSRSNLINGFASSFIYPCAPHLASELVNNPSDKKPQPELSKLYPEILTVHSQHRNESTTRIRGNPSTFVLTSNEFLQISKQQKFEAEIDKELRKTERKLKEKERKKEKQPYQRFSLQKTQGECCSCHKLCSDPKKCACLRKGRASSVSCTCKAQCENPNNHQ